MKFCKRALIGVSCLSLSGVSGFTGNKVQKNAFASSVSRPLHAVKGSDNNMPSIGSAMTTAALVCNLMFSAADPALADGRLFSIVEYYFKVRNLPLCRMNLWILLYKYLNACFYF